MFQQFVFQVFIEEAAGGVGVPAVLQEEEVVFVADAGGFIPVVGGMADQGYGNEAVGLDVPYFFGRLVGWEVMLDSELASLFGDGGYLYAFAGAKFIGMRIGIDGTVEFYFCPEAVITGSSGKTMNPEGIRTVGHSGAAGPCDVFYSHIPFRGLNIHIQFSCADTTICEIDMTVRGLAVCVQIVVAVALIVPLDAETKVSGYAAAGFFHVLADIGVGDVAGVCPAEGVIPLEHGRSFGILGTNERDEVLGMLPFHVGFHLAHGGQDIGEELFDVEFFYSVKGKGFLFGIGGHGGEDIIGIGLLHAADYASVGEEDVVDGNVIQSCESSAERVHIAHFFQLCLCVVQHFLSEDGLGAFIVGGSYDILVPLDGGFQIGAFGDIGKEGTDAVVADMGDDISGMYIPEPALEVLCFFGRLSFKFFLKNPESLQLVLPLGTPVQGILGDEFQNSVYGFQSDFVQGAVEHGFSGFGVATKGTVL